MSPKIDKRKQNRSIPSKLVEFILLGPLDDRRQLQDSPILGDVWVDFGKQPCDRLDLLIAPYRGEHAGEVATEIGKGLGLFTDDEKDEGLAVATKKKDVNKAMDINIAFLQGLVVARLTFREVMRVVVPKTQWWLDKWKEKDDSTGYEHEVRKFTPQERRQLLTTVFKAASAYFTPGDQPFKGEVQRLQELPSIDRFWALTGLILWAGSDKTTVATETKPSDQISEIVKKANVEKISELLESLATDMLSDPRFQAEKGDSKPEALVYQVSRNRPSMPALSKSVPAVKADAATYLFKVNCSQIGWAVIDSGIDGKHPAFLDSEGKSRVKRSFDFKNFRKILNLSNSKQAIRERNIAELMKDNESLLRPLEVPEDPEDPNGKEKKKQEDTKRLAEAHEDLKRLALDARKRGPVHWELVEKYVEIKPDTPPPTTHGTHVAGIIGANKDNAQKAANQAADEKEKAREAGKAAATTAASASENPLEQSPAKAVENEALKAKRKENPDFANGMCPDISLYDFRVLGHDIKDAEFAIIAALQFIRYINDRDNFFTIHGANLSLSIPHDVRNFACGRTPICDECERLVSNGVVVVAAAGNHGYKSFETNDGSYDSYAAFSITDPGNANNVLTVGATHRFWPHTYGVSFFSSRGPTGDGRLKPDLVAPGEKIRAPISGKSSDQSTSSNEWGDLDGTSMAAPHVSGAAAMLMARYSELVGQPLRVKRILCESATDLGRERSFQGNGMLDVLRAFQSI